MNTNRPPSSLLQTRQIYMIVLCVALHIPVSLLFRCPKHIPEWSLGVMCEADPGLPDHAATPAPWGNRSAQNEGGYYVSTRHAGACVSPLSNTH